jgi:hypothetical protein
MKKVINVLIPAVLLTALFFSSCNSGGKDKDQKKIDMDEISDITGEFEKAIYPLPTSAEVIKMLTELEVGYIIGISNEVDNAKNYITSKSQAINLGIYGADLSYATLYNMNQDVLNYLDAIRSLANNLNMSKIYSKALYDEIKDSFDSRDELVDILTRAFNNTYAYLAENEQQSLALAVVAGAWIEGMYITTHISESVYHVEGIVKVLLEQKESFDLFQEIAQPHAGDPVVKELLDIMEPVKAVYTTVEEGGLTLQNVEDITKVIETVRDKLVS